MMIRRYLLEYKSDEKERDFFMKDLISESHCDFICFQKTILQDFSDVCLRKFHPGQNFLWDWIPASGKSGGVLTGISSDRFGVGSRCQGEYILQHNLWDKVLEVKWNLLNVYGAAHIDEKECFLAELALFFSRNGGGGILTS
jgi:hypothetical protein